MAGRATIKAREHAGVWVVRNWKSVRIGAHIARRIEIRRRRRRRLCVSISSRPQPGRDETMARTTSERRMASDLPGHVPGAHHPLTLVGAAFQSSSPTVPISATHQPRETPTWKTWFKCIHNFTSNCFKAINLLITQILISIIKLM